MKDSFGRTIDYMRISVTDRCNLRCVYCMPEEGITPISHEKILRYSEISRLVRILAEDGLRKVKITGGEPLVRRGIPDLVRELKAISGIESVTLTTNGVLLEEMYGDLCDAGLDAVTISMDTVSRKHFREITRRDEADRVFRGFLRAAGEERIPLKVNCVPMGGEMAGDIFSVAELARDYPVHVRFIEMMPIGEGGGFTAPGEDAILSELAGRYGVPEPADDVPGNGPCRYYRIPGFKGRVGFISALSHKFCSGCNRVRLTSDGFLKTCLQYEAGEDLGPLLKAGAPDEEIRAAVRKALAEKPGGHCFGDMSRRGKDLRRMSQIGG